MDGIAIVVGQVGEYLQKDGGKYTEDKYIELEGLRRSRKKAAHTDAGNGKRKRTQPKSP
jgi:hypothetical protein